MKSVAIAKMVSSASTTTHTGTRMHSICDVSSSVAVPVDDAGISEEGQMMKALVSLELAGRGGETAAAHVKNVILQQFLLPSRERANALADNWHALPSSR
ncbi:hypothetical protein Tco_0888238 [Tanacetum coccineum]